MSVKGLLQHVRRMQRSYELAHAPKIIDATGEVEQLIAELEYKIREEGGDPDASIDQSFLLEPWVKELDAFLEQNVQDIEEYYHVRIVE